MQKIPHFFKVKSRIGLTNAPIRHQERNDGVEDGAEALITRTFLNNFPDSQVEDFDFTAPEKISNDEYWTKISEELANLKKQINQNLKLNETQVILGGDNTVTLSSLAAVIKRIKDPSKIGYIQFDSHGEMHKFKTSISKNFHGMYMRPFFDSFDIEEIDKLVPDKMKTSQILTIGDLVFDGENSEEEEFYVKNKIRNINKEEYLKNTLSILEEIKTFLKKYEHIHINFDIDVFDKSISEGTGLPEDGRWFKKEVFKILELIKTHSQFSIDLVEVNPEKDKEGKTVKLGQEILITLLKN